MRVAGLFAGIGGIELGLHEAGLETEMLCEIDDSAQRVLRQHFPGVDIRADIRELPSLPDVEVVAAGFPCQDLSMAGRKVGITGANSSLVTHLFRLVDRQAHAGLRWLVIENVPYMLHLDRGNAMTYLASALEERGFRWAYRVVDARSFGMPQRRQRVILLASRSEDPRSVLFADDLDQPPVNDSLIPIDRSARYGFYWTEGLRGLGWTRNAVPTVKGGSRLGIPSPPAVWNPETGEVGTPTLRDVERLQGFPPGWTHVEGNGRREDRGRWSLVGNAVCVPMSRWVGRRLQAPEPFDVGLEREIRGDRWPLAAMGDGRTRRAVTVSTWPGSAGPFDLGTFLEDPLTRLSTKAAAGFLGRARRSSLNISEEFLSAVEEHIARSIEEAGVSEAR